MSKKTIIKVPSLGESVTEAVIARWYKNVGDTVKMDDAVAELETDKVSIEVSSPTNGVLSEISAEKGSTVFIGTPIGVVSNEDADTPAPQPAPEHKTPQPTSSPEPVEAQPTPQSAIIMQPSPQPAPQPALKPVETQLTQKTIVAHEHQHQQHEGISFTETITQTLEGVKNTVKIEETIEDDYRSYPPSVRRMLKMHNINPKRVAPNGYRGVLSKEDLVHFMDSKHPVEIVEPAAKQHCVSSNNHATKHQQECCPKTNDLSHKNKQIAQHSAENAVDVYEYRAERKLPMSKLRQKIAERLKHSQNTAATLTTFNEADMSNIMGLRNQYKDLFEKRHGIKLGFMSFFIKASIQALKDAPSVNAEIKENEIIYKYYYDIGVAVSAPQGLIVPVIRNAERLSFAELEKQLLLYGNQARDGKLSVADLTGGTFTISNGGVFGSLLSTPILNPPQAAILGMHKIQERPVVIDGKIEIRPMMYLALSYDHRLIDGREAVTFLAKIKSFIEKPEQLLLEI